MLYLTRYRFVCLATAFLAGWLGAQPVSEAEARRVAESWTILLVQAKGSWGGQPEPGLDEAIPLNDGDQLLAYTFRVEPSGWIVVSVDRRLEPVRGYSTSGQLDLDANEGPAGFLRAHARTALRRLTSLPAAPDGSEELARRAASTWADLLAPGLTDSERIQQLSTLGTTYQGGEVLLSSAWDQAHPYNAECPVDSGPPPCTTVVGCVPLAAAQVMRYWNWPPYGDGPAEYLDPYDWLNMPDIIDNSSSPVEVSAVANLCREAGAAAEVDYGCDKTSGFLSCWWAGCRSMEDALQENFRYRNLFSGDRDDYSQQEWFERLKYDLNYRQPILYGITNHVVVVDGWQVVGSLAQYHVNYGWGGQNNGWFAVDAIPKSEDLDDESALFGLTPAKATSLDVNGTFARDVNFPFRYIIYNATGTATFEPGQNLQFLPGASLSEQPISGSSGIYLRSTDTLTMRLFSLSNGSSIGMRMAGGGIRLNNGGGFVLAPVNLPAFFRAIVDSHQQAAVLTWEPRPGIAEVVIEKRLVGHILASEATPAEDSSEWVVVAAVDQNHGAFSDSEVQNSCVYEYRVRGSSPRGFSEYSQVNTVMTPPSW